MKANNLSKAAVCGLYCEACTVYIGTYEDPVRLEKLATRFGMKVEEMKCDGCQAQRRTGYCAQCKMSACAKKKGINFCYECNEYPCEDIREFQAKAPHRAELWNDLDRIKIAGVETWLKEKRKQYSCSQCSTINSAYDVTCRKCGAEPGNEFVAEHRANIEPFL